MRATPAASSRPSRQPLGQRPIEATGQHQDDTDEGEDEEVVVVGHAEGFLREPGQRGFEVGEGEDRQEVDQHQAADAGMPSTAAVRETLRKSFAVAGAGPAGFLEDEHRDREPPRTTAATPGCAHAPGLLPEGREAEVGDDRPEREALREGDAD